MPQTVPGSKCSTEVSCYTPTPKMGELPRSPPKVRWEEPLLNCLGEVLGKGRFPQPKTPDSRPPPLCPPRTAPPPSQALLHGSLHSNQKAKADEVMWLYRTHLKVAGPPAWLSSSPPPPAPSRTPSPLLALRWRGSPRRSQLKSAGKSNAV